MYAIHVDLLRTVQDFQFESKKQKAVWSVVIGIWEGKTKKGISCILLNPLVYTWRPQPYQTDNFDILFQLYQNIILYSSANNTQLFQYLKAFRNVGIKVRCKRGLSEVVGILSDSLLVLEFLIFQEGSTTVKV